MVWAWQLPTAPIVLQLEQWPPNFKEGVDVEHANAWQPLPTGPSCMTYSRKAAAQRPFWACSAPGTVAVQEEWVWSWGTRSAKDDKGTVHVAPAACEMVKQTGANAQTNTRLVFQKRDTVA